MNPFDEAFGNPAPLPRRRSRADENRDRYYPLVEQAATRHNVPVEIFDRLIKRESGYNPTALGPPTKSGRAKGIGQFVDGTAARFKIDPYNPAQAINATGKYLRSNYDRFGRWDLAAAGYNAGEGAVARYGGVPPFRETQKYVEAVVPREYRGETPRYRTVQHQEETGALLEELTGENPFDAAFQRQQETGTNPFDAAFGNPAALPPAPPRSQAAPARPLRSEGPAFGYRPPLPARSGRSGTPAPDGADPRLARLAELEQANAGRWAQVRAGAKNTPVLKGQIATAEAEYIDLHTQVYGKEPPWAARSLARQRPKRSLPPAPPPVAGLYGGSLPQVRQEQQAAERGAAAERRAFEQSPEWQRVAGPTAFNPFTGKVVQPRSKGVVGKVLSGQLPTLQEAGEAALGSLTGPVLEGPRALAGALGVRVPGFGGDPELEREMGKGVFFGLGQQATEQAIRDFRLGVVKGEFSPPPQIPPGKEAEYLAKIGKVRPGFDAYVEKQRKILREAREAHYQALVTPSINTPTREQAQARATQLREMQRQALERFSAAMQPEQVIAALGGPKLTTLQREAVANLADAARLWTSRLPEIVAAYGTDVALLIGSEGVGIAAKGPLTKAVGKVAPGLVKTAGKGPVGKALAFTEERARDAVAGAIQQEGQSVLLGEPQDFRRVLTNLLTGAAGGYLIPAGMQLSGEALGALKGAFRRKPTPEGLREALEGVVRQPGALEPRKPVRTVRGGLVPAPESRQAASAAPKRIGRGDAKNPIPPPPRRELGPLSSGKPVVITSSGETGIVLDYKIHPHHPGGDRVRVETPDGVREVPIGDIKPAPARRPGGALAEPVDTPTATEPAGVREPLAERLDRAAGKQTWLGKRASQMTDDELAEALAAAEQADAHAQRRFRQAEAAAMVAERLGGKAAKTGAPPKPTADVYRAEIERRAAGGAAPATPAGSPVSTLPEATPNVEAADGPGRSGRGGVGGTGPAETNTAPAGAVGEGAPGVSLTGKGGFRLSGRRPLTYEQSADVVRIVDPDEDVSALRREWGQERFERAFKAANDLEESGFLDEGVRIFREREAQRAAAGQAAEEAAALREAGRALRETGSTPGQQLGDVLANASRQTTSYRDAKNNKRTVVYYEFTRDAVPVEQRRAMVAHILEKNPALGDKEWFIPGHGKSGLEGLIVDAGLVPAEVASRYLVDTRARQARAAARAGAGATTAEPAPTPAVETRPATTHAEPVVAGSPGPAKAAEKPAATGQARQVTDREVEAGTLTKRPEGGPTLKKGEAQARGEELVNSGKADYEGLAEEVGRTRRVPSAEETGVLLAGKRRLLNLRNNAHDKLDQAIKDGSPDVAALRAAAEVAQTKLDNYVEQSQQGFTAASDTFRALQDGTTLNEAAPAEVIQAAKRAKGAALDPKTEAQLKTLSERVKTQDEQIAGLERDLRAAEAQRETVKSRRTAKKQTIQEERAAIQAEVAQILKEAGSKTHDIGSAVYDSAKLLYAGGRIALTYLKEGAASIGLDEAIERTIADLKGQGLTATREQIEDDIAELTKGKPRTKTELAKAVETAKREARNSAKARADLAEYQRQLREGDYALPSKREVEVSQRLQNLRAERDIWKARVRKAIEAQKPKSGWQRVQQAGGLVKSLRSSFDLSAPGRQGWKLGFGNAGNWDIASRAFWDQLRAAKSGATAAQIQQEILGRENARLYKRAGLHLSEVEGAGGLGEHEEAFPQGLPGPYAMSERSYSIYLNKLRADVFDRMAKSLGPNPSDEALKALGQFVNTASGRGGTGKPKVEALAKALGDWIFSPRYVASQFEYAVGAVTNPLGASLGPTELRKVRGAITRQYVQHLGTMLAAFTLIEGARRQFNLKDVSVEQDPRSSDFGKVKIGNSRIDPWAGLQQPAVLAARLTTGQSKPLGASKPQKTDELGVMARFARTKMAPLPGTLLNLKLGKDPVGKPYTWKDAGVDLVAPISIQELWKGAQEDGWSRDDFIGLLNFLGISVQTIPPKAAKQGQEGRERAN